MCPPPVRVGPHACRAVVLAIRGVLRPCSLSQRRDTAIWSVDVEKGEKSLRGLHVDILGPVVVGRSPSSDIVIDEPYVSATHARLTLQGPALVLEDLGSKNGTLVNGHPVTQPVSLRDGDDVQVGDTVMRVSRR